MEAPNDTPSGSLFPSSTATVETHNLSDNDNNTNTTTTTTVLNDNDENTIKIGVSDDEGYVSGNEEFEPGLDKPSLVETEEANGKGTPFVDISEKVENLEVVEKGGDLLGRDSGPVVDGGGVGDFDGKGGILDSAEKLDEGTDDVEVKSGVEIADANAGNLDVERKAAKLTPEGDSVVETIMVDVKGPGVAVVGETEENGDASEAVAVEPEKSEVVGPGDVTLSADEDSIVDPIPVVSTGPDVAVVAEMRNNGETVSEKGADDFDGVAIVELEKPEVVESGAARLTEEGDAIVDSIKVDSVAPGVAVVGEVVEKGETLSEKEVEDVDTVAIVEPEKHEVVGPGDVELTAEGDSIVASVQVDPVAPGVAVVGDVVEDEGEEIKGVEVPLESVGGVHEVDKEVVGTREVAVPYNNSETSAEIEEPKNPQSEEAAVDLVNGSYTPVTSNDSVNGGTDLDLGSSMKKPDVDPDPAVVYESQENGITSKTGTDQKVEPLEEIVASDRDVNHHHYSNDGSIQSKEVEDEMDEEDDAADSLSDGDTDGMIFGSSEAARKFAVLEQGSAADSYTGGGSSLEQSQGIDGQIITDSEEEGDTDDEGGEKELFDSAALAALLKAATGADSDGAGVTITSQDGSRLFTVERPAGLGSSLRSLRPAPQPNRPILFNSSAISGDGESEGNLSEDEKKKLEKLQEIRVKFLRLVHRLGLSTEESVAAQVLYRLALLGGRQRSQIFDLDAAKQTALKLETEDKNNLDFSINILVLGKPGVGKSSMVTSLFGEEKASIDAFETGTTSVKLISGLIDGVQVQVVDTPGLKSSLMEQAFNRRVLSSVQKITKKRTPDVVLYADRLDSQTRDLNDLPLLKTVTSALGPSIWRSAIVTLTHAASAPPDGPSGNPLSYDTFVTQRSHVVQQSIGHAVGDLRMMSPSLMNPVSLVENHQDCRKNREGQKILPNGQSWRPQLLLLCYSMKILSEASSLSKPQDPFDHRKLFGFRARSPPLPYMLSSMLQSRTHPKLPSDQGGDNVDSDIDLDDLSDSDQEGADEYDQLPPFKPLRKAQLAKLSKDQRKAYFEEYDYRVKLLQKKQWNEELRRMREIKNKGKDAAIDYGFAEDDADSGAAAPVAVPLPDMALPPSFDGDNPAYRYRFLEPTSQFLARPVLDSHGWDHDCGYDGVNLEHSLALINRFPLAYTFQITKDKKDFSISLDSSISAKHGENMSSMAGFDIQSMGKQLAYIVRGETKFKKSKNKAAAGVSLTFLGDNTVPGVKIEDQLTLGKQYVLVGSAGAVRSQHDTAYGANIELQRRELDYPIGQVQSTVSMSVVKWRGDLALGFNTLAQFTINRNSKVAVRAGINNKLSGQVTVRTSSSEHLSLALAAILPTAISIYKKLWPGANQKYSIY